MKRWIALIVVLVSTTVYGVSPQSWQHSSQADFAKGKFENAAVNSRGEVALSRKVDIIFEADKAPDVVSAVVVKGETIYAAAGNKAVIFRISEGKANVFAELDGSMITAMIEQGEDLLVGVTGKEGCLYRVGPDGKSKKVWSDDSVKYIWAIVPGPAGRLYLGTGPKATVYQVGADGVGQVLYSAEKLAKNILCLTEGEDGILYAGTDEKGLVIRVDSRRKTSRIVLDADEKEVSALIVTEDGNVYVATSDVAKATPNGKEKPSTESKNGRAVSTKPSGSPQSAKAPKKESKAKEAEPKKTVGPKLNDKEKERLRRKALIKRAMANAKANAGTRPATQPSPAMPRPTNGPSRKPGGKGNAVYCIRPDGLVEEIFRKPVMIFAMQLHKGRLILGTGNGGKVYSITLDGDEVAELVDTDAKQVTAVEVMGDTLLFATANRGSVGKVSKDYAAKGTYLSEVMDARQIVQWGTMQIVAELSGAKVTIATRSGNVAEPDDATWSPWSKEQLVNDGFLSIMSPAGRFLQYRLTFAPVKQQSATVSQVSMLYQMGNLPAVVSGIKFVTSSRPDRPMPVGPQVVRMFTISASDPNKDKLEFTLEYRPVGENHWIKIAEDLAKPQYAWDTRTVGDGAYEVRVTASDSPSNPPAQALKAMRISDRIVVDNTPPLIQQLTASVQGDTISLRGKLVDARSRIKEMEYSVNSQEKWTAVLPNDGICDSQEERFSTQINDRKPGTYRIALRVTDAYGNVGYGYVTVTVAE